MKGALLLIGVLVCASMTEASSMDRWNPFGPIGPLGPGHNMVMNKKTFKALITRGTLNT